MQLDCYCTKMMAPYRAPWHIECFPALVFARLIVEFSEFAEFAFSGGLTDRSSRLKICEFFSRQTWANALEGAKTD
jgi:hypothetical protein